MRGVITVSKCLPGEYVWVRLIICSVLVVERQKSVAGGVQDVRSHWHQNRQVSHRLRTLTGTGWFHRGGNLHNTKNRSPVGE